jgi:AGCS family alanine or glycine:cation symporter
VDAFYLLIEKINSVVWGPPTVALLVCTGIFLTIRLGFIQIRKFGVSTKLIFSGKGRSSRLGKEGDITPVQALLTEVGGCVGTGTIAGVATAVAIGGPGAMFWMWLSGIFGMATKFTEVFLGVKFRIKAKDGTTAAGPMYYLKYGMNLPILGGAFAGMLVLGNFFTSPLMQTNSIALVFKTEFGIPRYITAILIAVISWVVIVGGIKSIARFSTKVVPFMVILFIGASLAVLLHYASTLPHAFDLIFTHAFSATAAVGGFAGAAVRRTLRFGVARGVMSNEAGIGTAGIIHGAAKTQDPVQQGLISLWGVFINTMLVCSMTGLTIIVSGMWSNGSTSSALVASAFNSAFPRIGGYIVAISLVLFGYTSLISGAYTGGQSCEYFLGSRAKRIYYWLLCGMMFIGGVMKVETVWSVGDIVNAVKIVPNLIALIGLSGIVARLTKDYFRKGGPSQRLLDPLSPKRREG